MRSGRLLLDRASVTRVLTSAETLALNTTAIQLVGAPAADEVLVPEYLLVSKPAGAAGAGGGNLQLRVGTTTVATRTRANAFPAGARVSLLVVDGDLTLPAAGAIAVNMATADMTGQDQSVEVTVLYSRFTIS